MQDNSFVSLTKDEKKLKQIIQRVLLESGILSIPPYDGNRKKYNIKSEVEWNTWCTRYVLRNFRKEVLQNGSHDSSPRVKSNSRNSRGKVPSKQDS